MRGQVPGELRGKELLKVLGNPFLFDPDQSGSDATGQELHEQGLHGRDRSPRVVAAVAVEYADHLSLGVQDGRGDDRPDTLQAAVLRGQFPDCFLVEKHLVQTWCLGCRPGSSASGGVFTVVACRLLLPAVLVAHRTCPESRPAMPTTAWVAL